MAEFSEEDAKVLELAGILKRLAPFSAAKGEEDCNRKDLVPFTIDKGPGTQAETTASAAAAAGAGAGQAAPGAAGSQHSTPQRAAKPASSPAPKIRSTDEQQSIVDRYALLLLRRPHGWNFKMDSLVGTALLASLQDKKALEMYVGSRAAEIAEWEAYATNLEITIRQLQEERDTYKNKLLQSSHLISMALSVARDVTGAAHPDEPLKMEMNAPTGRTNASHGAAMKPSDSAVPEAASPAGAFVAVRHAS